MTIAVIDDFEPDRLHMAGCAVRFFEEHDIPPPQIVFFSGGEEFIAGLSPHYFDLVLLDCRMMGMDGMETARELRRIDEEAALIFITSCRDYAIGGYLVSAAGYLVKPFTYETFSEVFSAAYQRMPQKRDIITIFDGHENKRILADDIVYCDIDGHYTQIHLHRLPVMRIRMPFSELLKLLEPYPQFLACYRGCLINMAHTLKAEELNFLMDTGERVPFRKKEHAKLLRKYSSYLFDKVRSDPL